MTTLCIPAIRTSLMAQLDRLTQRFRGSAAELVSERDNPDRRPGKLFDTAASSCTEEILRNDHTMIRRIEAALRSVDDGTYGTCEGCGEDIPTNRLEALPIATRCIACQSTFEERSAHQPVMANFSLSMSEDGEE